MTPKNNKKKDDSDVSKKGYQISSSTLQNKEDLSNQWLDWNETRISPKSVDGDDLIQLAGVFTV